MANSLSEHFEDRAIGRWPLPPGWEIYRLARFDSRRNLACDTCGADKRYMIFALDTPGACAVACKLSCLTRLLQAAQVSP